MAAIVAFFVCRFKNATCNKKLRGTEPKVTMYLVDVSIPAHSKFTVGEVVGKLLIHEIRDLLLNLLADILTHVIESDHVNLNDIASAVR